MTTLTSSANQSTLNNQFPQWKPATWEDYLGYRDDPTTEKVRLFFNNNYLFVDMVQKELIMLVSIISLRCSFYLV
jgi:hypothetical protein